MKKKVFGRNLGRSFTARRALFRSLTRAIVDSGEIKTTYAKAKAVLPFIEKLISLGKQGSIDARRRVYSELANNRQTTDNFFKIAKSFESQKGGYIRIISLPPRAGDSAPIVKMAWSIKVEETKEQKSVRAEKRKGSRKQVRSSQRAKSARDDKAGIKGLPALSKVKKERMAT